MSEVSPIFDIIVKNRDKVLSGGVTCIPFIDFERFSEYAPGVIKGNLDCVTGNTSAGKTTLAKKMYVWGPVEFAIKHKLDLKILYFALEESENQFDYTLLSYLIYRRFKIRVNIVDFESYKKPFEHADKIQAVQEEFKLWKSYIEVISNTYNTFGIYKYVRNFARERGTFYMDNVPLSNESLVKGDMWSSYIPNNPEEHIIVVCDHVGELHFDDKEGTLTNAIENWTKYALHYAAKVFNYTVLSIHQQAGETEDLDHIKSKRMKPSLQGLGDNKKVGRSYLNCYGIFIPARYDLQDYGGYNLNELGAYFRPVNILKQRYGIVGKEIPTYFDGCTGIIKSMPKLEDRVTMQKVYKLIETFK